MSDNSELPSQIELSNVIDTYKPLESDTAIVQEIVLYPNYAEVKVNGISKSISLLDFKESIDNIFSSVTKSDVIIHNDLPYNCFSFGKSSKEIQLMCYHPEKIRTVKHIDPSSRITVEYSIPFPNTIICYSLTKTDNDWFVNSVRYFCTNKTVGQLPNDVFFKCIDSRNNIWGMPFPNFYNDCNMCYGKNSVPTKFNNNLRGLDYYFQLIFISPFNDDLNIKFLKSNILPKKWFEELSTLTVFPYDRFK